MKARLVAIAKSSSSRTLAPARAAFLGLAEEDRLALVERIVISDGAPGFEDLDDLLMGGQVEVFSGLAVCPKSYYTGGAASSGHAPAVSDDYANTIRKADACT